MFKANQEESFISADAVTSDLRTRGNCLALATVAERIDKIDIALVDREAFGTSNINVKQSPGNTPVSALIDKHVDVTFLDACRLVAVAELISESVSKNKTVNFSKKEVTTVIVNAINKGLLDLDCLPDRIKTEVAKAIEKDG